MASKAGTTEAKWIVHTRGNTSPRNVSPGSAQREPNRPLVAASKPGPHTGVLAVDDFLCLVESLSALQPLDLDAIYLAARHRHRAQKSTPRRQGGFGHRRP